MLHDLDQYSSRADQDEDEDDDDDEHEYEDEDEDEDEYDDDDDDDDDGDDVESILGAKPRLVDEQQANEWIEANTQEMEEIEDLLTAPQLADLIGINHDQIVYDWLKKGHIVGWKNTRHDYVFPAGQFDKHGQPIKRLDRITQLFDDAYEMWYWLTTPNDALDGAEPLALLHKGEVARVKATAKGYLQGDFG